MTSLITNNSYFKFAIFNVAGTRRRKINPDSQRGILLSSKVTKLLGMSRTLEFILEIMNRKDFLETEYTMSGYLFSGQSEDMFVMAQVEENRSKALYRQSNAHSFKEALSHWK